MKQLMATMKLKKCTEENSLSKNGIVEISRKVDDVPDRYLPLQNKDTILLSDFYV